MPGTAELQSIATMEAMAAGLPVVAADAMALPHLVHSGRTGYLYRSGDVAELGGHLAGLAADPDKRAAMGSAGREVVARHSISRTLDAFEGLYRATAGHDPAGRAMAVPVEPSLVVAGRSDRDGRATRRSPIERPALLEHRTGVSSGVRNL